MLLPFLEIGSKEPETGYGPENFFESHVTELMHITLKGKCHCSLKKEIFTLFSKKGKVNIWKRKFLIYISEIVPVTLSVTT